MIAGDFAVERGSRLQFRGVDRFPLPDFANSSGSEQPVMCATVYKYAATDKQKRKLGRGLTIALSEKFAFPELPVHCPVHHVLSDH